MSHCTKLLVPILLLLFASHGNAQDFFGTAEMSQTTSGQSELAGQVSTQSSEDELVVVRLLNSDGEVYEGVGFLQTDGQFFSYGFSLDNYQSESMLMSIEAANGDFIGSGVVFVDTDDLGDDWTPLDINDDDNWTGCEGVADDIETRLGGTFTRPIINPRMAKVRNLANIATWGPAGNTIS